MGRRADEHQKVMFQPVCQWTNNGTVASTLTGREDRRNNLQSKIALRFAVWNLANRIWYNVGKVKRSRHITSNWTCWREATDIMGIAWWHDGFIFDTNWWWIYSRTTSMSVSLAEQWVWSKIDLFDNVTEQCVWESWNTHPRNIRIYKNP